MDNNRLYMSLKNKICEKIYRGIYQDGENIPPERTLADNLEVSRVTVRKALDLLEKDGILERVQGSGNIVRLHETGYEGNMDIIALLAPAQNPFFSTFIDYFQRNAENNDSLVLFKQNPRNERIEDSLFKLFQKNIRNAVIWLEDMQLDVEYIRRLRGLGMNMVFFDMALPTPYADCVLLDNGAAISALYAYLQQKGARNIRYVGWDNFNLTSVRERESGFAELDAHHSNPFHVSWSNKNILPSLMETFAKRLFTNRLISEKEYPDGIICGDGEIGIALKKSFLASGIDDILLASIDDFPESSTLSLSVYMQAFDQLAQKVYECLMAQNTATEKWRASIYPIKGKLIER